MNAEALPPTDTTEPEAVAEEATAVEASEPDPAPTRTEDIQRWYVYVDDGPGAIECEAEREKRGSCDEPEHFHAFCRLPNGFQHRDIREKALAAKARRARILRDPNTDAHDLLEDEMARLLALGDPKPLVDDLVHQESLADQLEAIQEVEEDERFEHIAQDRIRLDELRAGPEEQRSEDELAVIRRHLEEYEQAMKDAVEERQEPYRRGLEGKPIEDLVGLIREKRIDAQGTEEFLHTYNAWSWFLGTLNPGDRRTRIFNNIAEFQSAPPPVIEGIQNAFRLLESGTLGKS